MYENIKVIAMDLDGTLTQHKTPLSAIQRETLTKLSKKYKLLMVATGNADLIFFISMIGEILMVAFFYFYALVYKAEE